VSALGWRRYFFHIFAAAFRLAGLLRAVPMAFDVVR
jgi:hypothetical protein